MPLCMDHKLQGAGSREQNLNAKTGCPRWGVLITSLVHMPAAIQSKQRSRGRWRGPSKQSFTDRLAITAEMGTGSGRQRSSTMRGQSRGVGASSSAGQAAVSGPPLLASRRAAMLASKLSPSSRLVHRQRWAPPPQRTQPPAVASKRAGVSLPFVWMIPGFVEIPGRCGWRKPPALMEHCLLLQGPGGSSSS